MAVSVSVSAGAISLDRVRRGDCFCVEHIDDEMARVTALRFGMAEGAVLSCVTRIPAGPIVIKSGRQEIAIGRGLARRISVVSHSQEGTDAR